MPQGRGFRHAPAHIPVAWEGGSFRCHGNTQLQVWDTEPLCWPHTVMGLNGIWLLRGGGSPTDDTPAIMSAHPEPALPSSGSEHVLTPAPCR